jgi:hypothetical protein
MLIGDKYKIEADRLNITLSEKFTVGEHNGKGKPAAPENVGKERWNIIGYFSDIKHALWFMAKHDIKGTGLDDLVSVNQRLDEIHATIKGLALCSDIIKPEEA